MLSLLQCSSTIHLPNILTATLASKRNFRLKKNEKQFFLFTLLEKLDKFDSNKYCQLRLIQSLLYEFDRLQITSMEYAYLKLISIFNPINNKGT